MKRTTAFLSGLLIAVALGAVAQDSVIPSRLKLQALRVGAGAVPAAGNATVTGTLTVTGGAVLPAGATINGSTACSAANGACPQTTDASLLTTGTLAAARLPAPIPIAQGGTNLTAAADDNVMVGNGTTWQTKAIPTCSGNNGALLYNISTNVFTCNANLPRARAGRINIVSNVSCNQSDQQYDTGATATPNATGQCTVGWGTAFPINPLCVVSPIVANRTAFISARTTTSATVNLADLTGTAVNGSVDFICVGI